MTILLGHGPHANASALTPLLGRLSVAATVVPFTREGTRADSHYSTRGGQVRRDGGGRSIGAHLHRELRVGRELQRLAPVSGVAPVAHV